MMYILCKPFPEHQGSERYSYTKHYKKSILYNICRFDIFAGIVRYRRVAKANLTISARVTYLAICYHSSALDQSL